MRGIGQEGASALWRLNRAFIAWALPKIADGRLLHCGQLELFFDDTQLEVSGKHFEGAVMNYEGNTTLSWQTLWTGPFLAAGELGVGSRDCSELMPGQLKGCSELWKDYRSYLYADSGSSAGKYLESMAGSVDQFSVSYNKWTEGPERCAKELPESVWSAERIIRWRDGREADSQRGGTAKGRDSQRGHTLDVDKMR